jgi:hypothetical protein
MWSCICNIGRYVILQSKPALGPTQLHIKWVKGTMELYLYSPPGCVLSYFVDSYNFFQYRTCNGDPMFPFCDINTSGPADCCAFQLVTPMAMSEDHLCFPLLCFHRNLVRFMVPGTSTRTGTANPQPYDRFPSCAFWNTYEHDWQHVAPVHGPPESLRPGGGLRTSLNQLHVFGEVHKRKLRPLHPFIAAIHLPSFRMLTQCDTMSPHHQQCQLPPTNRLRHAQYHGLRMTGILRDTHGRQANYHTTFWSASLFSHCSKTCSNSKNYMTILRRSF